MCPVGMCMRVRVCCLQHTVRRRPPFDVYAFYIRGAWDLTKRITSNLLIELVLVLFHVIWYALCNMMPLDAWAGPVFFPGWGGYAAKWRFCVQRRKIFLTN